MIQYLRQASSRYRLKRARVYRQRIMPTNFECHALDHSQRVTRRIRGGDECGSTSRCAQHRDRHSADLRKGRASHVHFPYKAEERAGKTGASDVRLGPAAVLFKI